MNLQTNSENNAVVVAFEDFITNGTSAQKLKKDLSRLYVQFTRLLIKYPDEIRSENDAELYCLSELIEVLECSDQV
jgi:hypothetical protein